MDKTIKNIVIRYGLKNDNDNGGVVLKSPKLIKLFGAKDKLIEVTYNFMRLNVNRTKGFNNNYVYNTAMFSHGTKSTSDVKNVYFPKLIKINDWTYEVPIKDYKTNFKVSSNEFYISCDPYPNIRRTDPNMYEFGPLDIKKWIYI